MTDMGRNLDALATRMRRRPGVTVKVTPLPNGVFVDVKAGGRMWVLHYHERSGIGVDEVGADDVPFTESYAFWTDDVAAAEAELERRMRL